MEFLRLHPKNCEVIVCVCKVFISSATTFENRKLAGEVGILDVVCEAFSSFGKDEYFVITATKVISVLSHECSENGEICAKVGYCILLSSYVKDMIREPKLLPCFLSNICELSYNSFNRQYFGSMEFSDLFQNIIKKNNDDLDVCSSLCLALGAVASNLTQNKENFSPLTELVIKVLKIHRNNMYCVQTACVALAALCAEHKLNSNNLVSSHVVEFLLQIFTQHIHSKELVTSMAKLLYIVGQQDATFAAMVLSVPDVDLRFVLLSCLTQHGSDRVASLCVMKLLRLLYATTADINMEPLSGECESIINILRTHANDSDIIVEASLLIHDCCKKRQRRYVDHYGTIGGCELLARLCDQEKENKESNVLKCMLEAISRLCTGSQSNQELLGKHNLCTTVSHIMRRFNLETSSTIGMEVQERCLNLITLLCRYSKDKSSENMKHIQLFHQENVCFYILAILRNRMESVEVVHSACRAIYVLVVLEESCVKFVELKGCDFICKSLKKYAAIPSIVQCLCICITNICIFSEGRRGMFEADICEPFMKSIASNAKDPNVALQGCNALVNLSTSSSIETKVLLGSCGACSCVHLIWDTYGSNIPVMIASLIAMNKLITKCLTNIQLFINSNGPKKICDIISNNVANKEICNHGLRAMQKLCVVQLVAKQIYYEEGFLEILSTILKTNVSNIHVLLAVCHTLKQLFDVEGCSPSDDTKHVSSYEFKDGEFYKAILQAFGTYDTNDEVLNALCDLILSISATSQFNREMLMFHGAYNPMLAMTSKPVEASQAVATQVCCCARFLAVDLQSKTNLRLSGICVKICHIFQIYSNKPDVIKSAAQALLALCADCSDNVDAFIAESALDFLKSLLESHFNQYECCSEISKSLLLLLDYKCHDSQMEDFGFKCCDAICKYLGQNINSKKAAYLALSLISQVVRNNDDKQILEKIGVCETLVQTLKLHSVDEKVVISATACAYALAVDSTDLAKQLSTEDMCDITIQCIKIHASNVESLTCSLKLACILSLNKSIRVYFGTSGLCTMLVKILKNYKTENILLVAALNTVKILATNVPENKLIFSNAGMIELSLELMTENIHDSKIVELTCGVAAILSKGSSLRSDRHSNTELESNVMKMMRGGLCEAFVAIFSRYMNEASILKQVLLIIKNMAATNSANNNMFTRLADFGICEKVVFALAAHLNNSEINYAICDTLRSLSIDSNLRIVIGNSGGIEIIVKLLRLSIANADKKLSEEAIRTLTSLIKNSCANQEMAGRCHACSVVLDIIGDGNDPQLDEQCLWCIANLCRCGDDISTVSENNSKSFSDVSTVEYILSSMGSHKHNVLVIEAGCWAIRNICSSLQTIKYVLSCRGIENMCLVIRQHFQLPQICEAAIAALAIILSINQELTIGSTGICELIVNCIQNHQNETQVVIQGSHCILSLIQMSTEYKMRICSIENYTTIINACKLHVASNTAAKNAVEIILYLSQNSPEYKSRLGSGGTFALFVDMIAAQKHDVETMTLITKAVKFLTDNQSENFLMCEAYGIFGLLSQRRYESGENLKGVME